MVVKQPKFTRVEEPTLLCNQVPRLALRIAWLAVYFGLLFVIHVGGLNTHASD
jgi:hypothetical protein